MRALPLEISRKEVTYFKSQIAAVVLKLDLSNSDIEYKIAAAVFA